MLIEVKYSEESMFGNDPDAIIGIDIEASLDKFDKMLSETILRMWSDAEIVIERGDIDSHSVDGSASSDDAIALGEIIHRVWNVSG